MDAEDSGPTAYLNFHIPLTASIDVDGWKESRLRFIGRGMAAIM